MKNLLLLLTLVSTVSFAQSVTITKAEYQSLKDGGNLDPAIHYVFSDPSLPSNVQYSMGTEKNGVCDCMVALDSTFTLAMGPNDDESSAPIALPFTFDFYGTTYDTTIINNNGNISFLAPYYEFTPNAFPSAWFNMIAPFWGDVDTRSANGGQVWYKVTPTALIVIWNEVGYYSMHEDLKSTFQLIITEGTDALIPSSNNVSFCYQDMQWTTGDASSGVGGFGGSASTVGVNIGDGVNFFQVGQYDHPGISFDGPYGANDGIDFLDGQEIYFNVAGAANSNTPPLLISSAICDTIDVYTGDTLVKSNTGSVGFSLAVATPESNQILNTVISCSAPGAVTYTETSVTPEFVNYDIEFTADGLAPGFYTISIVATDNGTPVGITTKEVVVEVLYDESLALADLENQAFVIFPNPTADKATIQLNEAANGKVTVTDFSGKIILTQEINEITTLDLATFAQGTYLVTIATQNGIVGQQLIVKQ